MKTMKIVTLVGSLLLICSVVGTSLPVTALQEEENFSDQSEQDFVDGQEAMEKPADQYNELPMDEEEEALVEQFLEAEPDHLPLGDPMYTLEGELKGE